MFHDNNNVTKATHRARENETCAQHTFDLAVCFPVAPNPWGPLTLLWTSSPDRQAKERKTGRRLCRVTTTFGGVVGGAESIQTSRGSSQGEPRSVKRQE